MSQLVREGDRLVLESDNSNSTSNWRGINLQLLTPLLLGLLIPLMAVNYFEPTALRHMKMPIFLFLVVMFFICSALFFYTAHFPGKIDCLVVHREERAVELVWRNQISTTSQFIPFAEISSIRVRNDYDDDGYSVQIAELVLKSKAPLPLPDGTSEEHVRPLRAAIGLG